MASIELKEILNANRFPSGWNAFLVVLYAPVGILIALLRLLVGMVLMVAASIVPQASFLKSVIIRATCFVLGIIVKQEDTGKRDPTVQLIVSNHISLLDHMAVHLVSGCVTVSFLELPLRVSRVLGVKDVEPQQGEAALENEARQLIRKTDEPLLCFPERSTTSGRQGLLKFSPWPFRVSKKVQPVALKSWRPPVADVALTVLGARDICDILWFMFVPFTVFTVRYLPVVELREDDPEASIQQVESSIASSLRIKTTKFTASDKAEYEKRYLAELYPPVIASSPPPLSLNSEIHRMCLQVKDVLPLVPAEVIYRDLLKTHSVDVTITNILDGHVHYTPEQFPPPSTSTSASARPSKSSQASGTLNFFTQTSPQKRAMTFQEKKAVMIENARKKYIEKHGLRVNST